MAQRVKKSKIPGFRDLRTELCPACLDRNAITLDGRPVRNSKVWHEASTGCDVCGGSARIQTVEKIKGDWPRGDRWVYRAEVT